jgi:hypothetical protein
MSKACLARVDVQESASLVGELVWLVPPKVMKEI